jgi:hypothetical protein
MSNLDRLEARSLILHNDMFHSLRISEHFLITIASQKLPTEMDKETIDGSDWEGAYVTMVTIARKAIVELKTIRPSHDCPRKELK